MVYLGRILGIGLSEDGKPAAVYGLTGRSPASKQRIARVVADEFIPKVKIESKGQPSSEQLKQGNLLFYDAITAFTDLYKGQPYLAISNGCQTNHLADRTSALPLKDDSLVEALKFMGYEPDSLRTPRIAGEIRFHRKEYNCPTAMLGIITENQRANHRFMVQSHELGSEGSFKAIATYSGKNDEKPEAMFWPNSLEDVIEKIHLKGSSAQEIADSMYAELDKRYRVSTAAAVWNGKMWDMAVTNMPVKSLEHYNKSE